MRDVTAVKQGLEIKDETVVNKAQHYQVSHTNTPSRAVRGLGARPSGHGGSYRQNFGLSTVYVACGHTPAWFNPRGRGGEREREAGKGREQGGEVREGRREEKGERERFVYHAKKLCIVAQ